MSGLMAGGGEGSGWSQRRLGVKQSPIMDWIRSAKEQEVSARVVWFGQLGDGGAVHSESTADAAAVPHVP